MMRAAILLALLFALAPSAYAQDASIGFSRELALTISPEYPAPGQQVTLAIKTFAIDLNRSEVVWYANKREIARGEGLVETTITAGPDGSVTEILVVAEDESGVSASAEATIRPSEIDILWEATSYAPPFYEGRILPGSNSSIRAQALARFRTASGTLVPESSIIYTWYRNGTVVASGRGKSTATIPGPELFGASTIRVTAVSADNAFSGAASTRIDAVDPFAMFYENHPLFGVLYHRALDGSVNTLETELQVAAIPYFAGTLSPTDPSLIYEWEVNGRPITADAEQPEILTLAANGYRGPLDISLSLMSMQDIALRAVGKWRLVFGSEDTSFFSGVNPFGGNQ